MVRAGPTHSTIPHQPISRPQALIVGLSVVVLTVAVLQTAVVPVLGINARTLGSSIAAALVAVLLGRTADGTSVPMESSFVAIFVGGAVTGAMALIALSRIKAGGINTVEARYEFRAMNHECG